jgi:hypothetical protein
VQKIGQMAGEELAATMMGQRPNSMMSKVVPQPLFAVAPEQGLLSARAEPIESLLQTKPQAPVSDIGFYSATEQAALNLGRNKGTGQSFINDLMKAPDVKKEELAYTGLDDFLRDKPNVTKQEVQDFLANNRVDVQEVRLGDAPPPAPPPVLDAERLNLLEKEFSQLKEHPIDAPNFGQEKFDELMMLQNIRDNSTVETLYNSADSATRAAQRAQAQGRKDVAEKYFKQAEMFNSRAEALDLRGLGVPEQVITNPTKFDRYTLAGGENYREILLTLPFKEPAMPKGYQVTPMQYDDGTVKYFAETPTSRSQGFRTQEEAQEQLLKTANNLKGFRQNLGAYQSSHFNEPNILAHMRVNDRVDADGKKMLLVEEIQSDWHQAGREKGYKGKGTLKELPENYFVQEIKTIDGDTMYVVRNKDNPSVVLNKDYNRQSAINGVVNELNASSAGGVPDAPFKDTWYQLALKRLTKYAADNGYERIGLTTGKQQAGRYALSNEVDEINVIGRTNMATGEKSKSVALDMKSGQSLRIGVNNDGIVDNVSDESIKNFMGKNLSEVVGKDIAKEIMLNNKKTISGEGLDIGGEGMKKYYDEIYPKFLDKYGKKYGASVGETQITTDYARDASGIPAQRPSKETIRYLDITPQMKEGTSKGQPLFAATPLLPATSLLDEEKRKEITSLLE